MPRNFKDKKLKEENDFSVKQNTFKNQYNQSIKPDEAIESDEKQRAIKEDIIVGRNPVMEAIKSGREIEHIFISQGEKSGSIISIISLAKEKGLLIKECNVQKLNFLTDSKNHQGVAAVLSSTQYYSVDEIVQTAQENKGLIIICDEIEDPHNLGAIIRTADGCGADGVIVPKRRCAPIAATCYKASAGACNHVKIAKVSNLAMTIDKLKNAGYWIYAAEMDSLYWDKADYTDRNIALIIGSEGKGVSRLLKEKCDQLVSIPMFGKINSLNASVATGVILYEITRQRINNKK
ncbi:MAG: 23S rRNA (guanosine(2251)-2'-O)-methyltransferase RlmB, partial [Oscillospiraceae bacterium]